MGRSLQVVGLLIMLVASSGIIVVASGDPSLVALANPCVPPGLPGNTLEARGVGVRTPPPVATPTPGTLVQAGAVITPPPNTTANPIATRPPATQLSSYPVFGATEELASPTASPTPTPLPSLTPEPSPSPTLPPCPVNRHRLFGAGPIEFSGTGSMDLGTHNSSDTSSGLSQSLGQDAYTVGMQVAVSRRTDESAITVSQAFGEFNGAGTLSGLDVGYSTPKYLLNYGQVSGPSDTQLSNGSFTEGVTLGVPHGADEYDLLFARTSGGVNNETFRVAGLRHSRNYRNGATLSQVLYDAFGEQGGRALTFDTSYTQYGKYNSLRLEAAASNSRYVATVPDGTRLAYGLQENLNGRIASTTISYTSIPFGYVSLGQVQYQSNQFQLTERRPFFGKGSLTFSFNDMESNAGLGTTTAVPTTSPSVIPTITPSPTPSVSPTPQTVGNPSTRTNTTSITIGANMPFGKSASSSLTYNTSDSSGGGIIARQSQISATLSELMFGTSLQESYTAGVDSTTGVGLQRLTQTQITGSRPLAGGFITVGAIDARNEGEGASSDQTDFLGAYTKQIGMKAQISLSGETLNNVVSGASGESTRQLTETVSITRRLSPVIGLRLTSGSTRQSGSQGGVSRYFNVDIVGPIALGTAARYNGRINPNLPSVIQGNVYLESAGSSFGLAATRGIPNVLVTLDGGLTQRTDVTGAFEFRFVRPGPHIVSVTTGTLPAGTIPDSSSQSLTIQGGQIAQVNFAAGVYGGVGGFVTETIGGKDVPVPNVQLLVDGKDQGYTGVDGSYEIGHLDNGQHTIEISADSLPATLAVAGDEKQNVVVTRGSVATTNFKLLGLGSISGQILLTADAGFGDLAPAPNVYVVADPGQHAAITDDSGDYIIDNLEPGTYTLSLDQDTLPDNQSIIQGPDGPVNVEGGSAIEGVGFKLGPQAKMVVMGFGAHNATVNVAFRPERVPPNGTTQIIVTTDEKAKSVTAQSDLFGTVSLHFDPSSKAWVATVPIPAVPNNDYTVHVDVSGPKSGSSDTAITVDSKLPLIVAKGAPANPKPGQVMRVILKVSASNVAAGDLVVLEDGAQLRLPAGHGNVYAFTITVKHPLPYRGLIFTKAGVRYPFVILP